MTTRDKLQQELELKYKTTKFLLLEHATAFGKTLSALKLAIGKTLIVFKELTHKINIQDEILKHEYSINDYSFVTYRSLHKLKGEYFDTIIFDEANCITWNIIDSINKIKSNKHIYLSASVNYKKLYLLKILTKNKLIVDTKTIKDGIELGILPIPKIKLHYITLDNTYANHKYEVIIGNPKSTKILSLEKWKSTSNFWNSHYIFRGTALEKYQLLEYELERINTLIENAHPSKKMRFTLLKKRIGLLRKNFLAELKNSHSHNLFESLDGKKLMFANSISDAEDSKYTCIHSGLNSKKIEEIIKNFKQDDIDALVTVKMLRESHNIPNLKHVVVNQLDFSNFINFIQIQGRALRSEDTIFHIIIVKNTIDEEMIFNLIHNKLIDPENIIEIKKMNI